MNDVPGSDDMLGDELERVEAQQKGQKRHRGISTAVSGPNKALRKTPAK